MTLTHKRDLDLVEMNHRVEYLGQRSFRSKVRKVIVRTHTDTHTAADRSTGPLKWSLITVARVSL